MGARSLTHCATREVPSHLDFDCAHPLVSADGGFYRYCYLALGIFLNFLGNEIMNEKVWGFEFFCVFVFVFAIYLESNGVIVQGVGGGA